MNKNFKGLTKKEVETIEKEYAAFCENFEEVSIEKINRNYFVFKKGETNYCFYTTNINVIKGWLYGAVQANCKVIKTK